ncbi:MAG: M36 family metallopeptidase [Vicinamibacterales bacterium]
MSDQRRHPNPTSHGRVSRHWTRSVLVLSLVVAATAATFSQSGPVALGPDGLMEPNPNFDIRSFKADPRWENDQAAAAYVARFQPAPAQALELAVNRVSGVARLEAAFKGIAVENSPTLGTTEIVSAMPGTDWLTPASDDRVAALRGFLAAHAAAYGVTDSQASDLALVSDYVNPAGNMGWAELEQRFNNIPVFQGRIRGGFTAKGELARTTGLLASGIDAGSLSTTPSVSAAQAISLAAASVSWKVAEASLAERPSESANHVSFDRGTMAGEPSAWLVYFPLAEGVVRLAWATQIIGNPDAYLSVIDGETGTLLFRKNMTEYQTQSATYVVYPSDSPAPASPSTSTPASPTQAPYVARQTFTLIGNEAPYTFNNLGWMTDGTNGANGHTDGNNVEAGVDVNGTDGVDAPVPGVGRVFNFAYNPETDSPATAAYRNGDVTNMFYWVNRYHDLTYLLGFTEVAGNFQNDNFGRGGVAGDRVRAEGQDSSGTNNANMLTPADGGRGRMQMFVWTGPTPDRSGDLDQDVIFHELTHGTSNRLHANASGLSTNMARGMGEGWSDFVARSLLSDPGDDPNGLYTTGGWVTYQLDGPGDNTNYYYGIRRFPYAPRAVTGGPMNRPHSPLTFADADSTQADLSDGAFPRGPVGSATLDQVHNLGEIWAGMLWEVRARFVTRLGGAVGNQRFLQWVIDGMKLDPVGPTFIQARDAIIAAANAGGATPADIADIWAGFATRGLGTLASVDNAGTGANNTRVTESFLRPGDPTPTFTINDVTALEGNSGTTTFTFTVSLANPSPGVEHRVSFATADGTATNAGAATTFTANTPTSIPAGAPTTTSGPAGPYPVTLNVSGMPTSLLDLNVRINGLTHEFLDDIDMLLVGPGGQKMVIQSDVGGSTEVLTPITYTIDDQAADILPDSTAITNGTYRPSNVGAGDAFVAPAPAGPHRGGGPSRHRHAQRHVRRHQPERHVVALHRRRRR